jgi:SAM-dependent methyltransferase
MNCRFCNNPLNHLFIDLVNSPPSNAFLKKEQLNEPEVFYPLNVFVCSECLLAQVPEYKKAVEIFDNEYAYFSSFSQSWLAHSRQYVEKVSELFSLNAQSLVIEIASNDGYLLQYFQEKQIPVLGIEPTLNTAEVARKKGIDTLNEFFGVQIAEKLAAEGKKADLLLGNNVLAHVPDINDFVKGMSIVLKKEGIITMEFPHLLQLIEHNQFDTIYHEHFSYFSLYAVRKIFEAHNLTLFDVEELSTHGGSLRIYARHTTNNTIPVKESIATLLNKEENAGLASLTGYHGFQEKADKIKTDLIEFLIRQKQDNKTVVAYGAAAKGNTLLNYCGIKKDLLAFVVDKSPYKQNKFLPGGHIPVLHEDAIRNLKPDYVLILPWNIKEEITEQLSYIKAWQGKFVVAIPELKILD